MPEQKDEIKVRLDADLKRAFQLACRDRDMTASQVIRRFMRRYVAAHASGSQVGLFDSAVPGSPYGS